MKTTPGAVRYYVGSTWQSFRQEQKYHNDNLFAISLVYFRQFVLELSPGAGCPSRMGPLFPRACRPPSNNPSWNCLCFSNCRVCTGDTRPRKEPGRIVSIYIFCARLYEYLDKNHIEYPYCMASTRNHRLFGRCAPQKRTTYELHSLFSKNWTIE